MLVTGCGENSTEKAPTVSNGKIIGVAMPTQTAQRWIQDGDYIKEKLEEQGYVVDLKYAEDDVNLQITQLQEMIDEDASCLVVATIDSTALVDVLEKANQKNIPAIAYDRLLMDTDDVSYYASFDNKGVGLIIGRYIEAALGLKEGKGPFNVEFFAGSPDDNNAHFLNEGVFEILQPYIDSGRLQVLSGETDFNSIAIMRWSEEGAKQRMKHILDTYYKAEKVDAVISPYDGISYGIAGALEESGYIVRKNWPLITGQDAELKAVQNIIQGRQSMTVFKDTRVLADKCATMVAAVLDGKVPEINDTITYDNRKMVVPSFLCMPVTVDKGNIDRELIESGYYTKAEVYGK